MRRNRRVTLLCYDPRQPLRYLEVRGMVAEMTEAGAAGHLDCLAYLLGNQKVSLHLVAPLCIQERGDRAGHRPPSAQKDHSGTTQVTTLTTGSAAISAAVCAAAGQRW